MSAQEQETPKGRRVSIDLTSSASLEVDRLREQTGLSTADMFRYGLHLFRLYVDERSRGKMLFVATENDPTKNQMRIELPLDLRVVNKDSFKPELESREGRGKKVKKGDR
jgi:hypothetical protein